MTDLNSLTQYFREQDEEEERLHRGAKLLNLRMVPTFSAAHTFCASRDTRVSNGWWLLVQGYFKTMRRKQNLASAVGIHKENLG